jgi:subtilase family serine protease
MEPDLLQVAVSNPPLGARAGDRFEVTDTVRNEGNAIASRSRTRFYLSIDTEKDTGDRRLIGARAVPKLAAGQELSGTTILRIPRTVTPGTYFLLACSDNRNVLAESNEENNCRASETQVTVQ